MFGSPPAWFDVSWSNRGSLFVCFWKSRAHFANSSEAPATRVLAERSPSSTWVAVSGDGRFSSGAQSIRSM